MKIIHAKTAKIEDNKYRLFFVYGEHNLSSHGKIELILTDVLGKKIALFTYKPALLPATMTSFFSVDVDSDKYGRAVGYRWLYKDKMNRQTYRSSSQLCDVYEDLSVVV